jgi:phosphoribosylglycinamide formyltransferase 1
MLSLVILISGRGSNMEAILAAKLPVHIKAVISNRPDAKGLQTATAQGIATAVIDHKAFTSRDDFDAALATAIDQHAPDLIILAGFMRVLGAAFIAKYPNRIINIHPSLLPSYPGLHTHQRAIDDGVKIHGATVHIVTPALDHGPILMQAAVPVRADDTAETLATRVLEEEHILYPAVIRAFAAGNVKLYERDGQTTLAVVQTANSPVIPDANTARVTSLHA